MNERKRIQMEPNMIINLKDNLETEKAQSNRQGPKKEKEKLTNKRVKTSVPEKNKK
jgi:hypothetical protein